SSVGRSVISNPVAESSLSNSTIEWELALKSLQAIMLMPGGISCILPSSSSSTSVTDSPSHHHRRDSPNFSVPAMNANAGSPYLSRNHSTTNSPTHSPSSPPPPPLPARSRTSHSSVPSTPTITVPPSTITHVRPNAAGGSGSASTLAVHSGHVSTTCVAHHHPDRCQCCLHYPDGRHYSLHPLAGLD
ncbi:hypothetical protein AX774_g6672, partial [Zancudomyces culisetae]